MKRGIIASEGLYRLAVGITPFQGFTPSPERAIYRSDAVEPIAQELYNTLFVRVMIL
jgi:hypothetical protein